MVIVFALTGHFYLAILAILTRGVMGALIGPLYNAWLVQNIPSQTRATVVSMVGQANAIGQVAGGPGIGAIGNQSLRFAILLTGLLNIPVLPLYQAAEKQEISLTSEKSP
jgi:DHA3 family tetracycline resistance protein-like MFS transporter